MFRRLNAGFGGLAAAAALLPCLLFATASPAAPVPVVPVPVAPGPSVHQEIDYLLSFVGDSGCTFYRNGSWYQSVDAAAHLRAKYNSAAGIHSAEEFIKDVASSSSISGRPYLVKCGVEQARPTAGWLTTALLRFRTASQGR